MSDKSSSAAHDFLRKLWGFSLPTWISAFISFLSIPFTTRLFSTEVVGQNNMFTMYLTFFMMIAYMGMDQSFARFYNEQKEEQRNILFNTTLVSVLVMTSILGVIICFGGSYISKEVSGYTNTFVPVCMGLSLLGNVLLRFFSIFYRMANKILAYTIVVVLISIIGKLSYLLVAFWNPSHYNVVWLMTLGYVLAGLFYSWIYMKKECAIWHIDRQLLPSLLKFGLPLVPATILSWLNSSIPQLMLNRFESYSAIGIYSNAVAVTAILSLLQSGFNTYWVPFVYENYQKNQTKIRKVHNLITLSMVLFGLFIILGQDIIYYILGEDFRSSKIFFPFLLMAPICYTVAETTGLGISISKKTYLNLWVFGITVLVNLVLCRFLLPLIGIEGAAISVAISSITMLVIKTWLGEKYYKCIDSYWKTAVAMSLILMAAFINLMFFEEIVLRYLSVLFLIAVILVIYEKDVVYLRNILMGIVKDKIKF